MRQGGRQWQDVAKEILADWEYSLSPREEEFLERMTRWRGLPTIGQQEWMARLADKYDVQRPEIDVED